MRTFQEWIHTFEEGAGSRWILWAVFILGLVALATVYNFRGFRHFEHPEAMDQAQVARQLAEGKGFTTKFVRPAALFMVERKTGKPLLDEPHPDVANAPLYPWLLSLWMRVGGFDYDIDQDEEFESYQPERRIAWFNQFWFIVAILLTWWLARSLFDDFVAWITAGLLAGTDLLWRFSVSGLSTCLLMCLCVALALVMVDAERRARESEETSMMWLLVMAAIAGVLVGASGLTRYSMAWLIIPVIGFFSACFHARGAVLGFVALAGFLITMTPWLARNYALTESVVGAAGMRVHQLTVRFPGDTVERLMNPEDPGSRRDVRQVGLGEYWAKLDEHLPAALQKDLPGFGGNWVVAYFLVGLLVPFRNPSIARLRWWVTGSLFLLLMVQTLGRTYWGQLVPEVNSDNLLVALAPLVFMLGAGMFAVVIDQSEMSPLFTQRILAPGFVLVMSLPLAVKLTNGEANRFAYPPYYPPVIQERGDWMDEGELTVSDVPWAMSWYGDRQSVWMPASFGPGFIELYRRKPVNAVYLTSLTLDQKLVTGQLQGNDPAVGRFVAEAVVNEEIPPGFPLKHAFADGFPYQLFLADRPRWKTVRTAPPAAVKNDEKSPEKKP